MAKVELPDSEIEALIAEPKELPPNYGRRFRLKPRRGHSEASLDITTDTGHRFRFILRQRNHNVLDFSAILGYYLSTGKIFILRRYNGKSHEHTNSIEQQTFYDFHIHMATERYHARGFNEEKYAEPTSRYATLKQAFECLMDDCNVRERVDEGGQGSLFGPES
jgi:hypothetical protein